ncbi:MAG: DUF11 domain-containing protein, partial [Gemmatimonadaceae bacterium]|nr:DUF11 domain-containing protein [Gemmatimonadaceae bacterium]
MSRSLRRFVQLLLAVVALAPAAGAEPAANIVPPLQGPVPDVAIDKSHSGNLVTFRNKTYRLRVTNTTASPTPAPITVVDTLPAGLRFVSATGSGWTCSATGQVVTCQRSTPLGARASSSISLVVYVDLPAAPAVTNRAHVSMPGDGVPSNDHAVDAGAVEIVADVGITKTANGPFAVGSTASYTLAVQNRTVRTGATVTVRDTLPPGLTYQSATGAGWSCSAAGNIVTCSTTTPIPLGVTSSVILTVNVGPAAVPSVRNRARVSTKRDENPLNDTSSVTVPVSPGPPPGNPDLAIAKVATGSFTVGSNASYTLTVSNPSANPTTGPTTVTDLLPAGLAFVSATGPGWS